MAKTPRIGHGKSRLAREAGRVAAWRINRFLHARTMSMACDVRWTTVLAISPDRDVNVRLPGIWPARISRLAQGRGDLGARMMRAMMHVRGPVAVIGTDCPDATRRDLAAAFAALRKAPVAIGAAPDGGFWILAARRARDVAVAFRNVRWSSARTLADVESKLRVRAVRLRTLPDIDTLEDWRAFRRRRQRAP